MAIDLMAGRPAESGQMELQASPIQTPKKPRIGREEIRKANSVLQKYKDGKKALDERVIANHEWYKVRHWEQIRGAKGNANDPEPASAWLFNIIDNKHADAMDNYPEPNILPREKMDVQEAKMLTAIMPVVMKQNKFEGVYSDVWYDALKSGTGFYGVFWNSEKLNGFGDIDIEEIDILNLYWEAGVKDIQKSRNVFNLEIIDNEVLEQRYPQLRGKLGSNSSAIDIAQYIHDDAIDCTNKAVVVDWYYKVTSGSKTVLHYCKYVNDEVLYASENDPNYVQRGFYDHGKYPFIPHVIFPEKDSVAGFGYIDVFRNPQLYIDKLNKYIQLNSAYLAKPRYLFRQNGAVNIEDFTDPDKTIIPVNGQMTDNDVRRIDVSPLNNVYLNVLTMKIDEMKETSGNRDFSQGGTTNGVTAASAISALMEAGSKTARDRIRGSYRAYMEVCYLIIELIRQFYDEPRQFRITGDMGQMQFADYNNANIKERQENIGFGLGSTFRTPEFDVDVIPQKASLYSKMTQNELALQFFQYGFFNPQMAEQALACLDMMDFDGKDRIMQKISQNSMLMTLVQQYGMMLAQLLAQQDPEAAQQILMQLQQIGVQISGGVGGGTPVDLMQNNPLGQVIGAGQTTTQKKTTEKAANQASV